MHSLALFEVALYFVLYPGLSYIPEGLQRMTTVSKPLPILRTRAKPLFYDSISDADRGWR